MELRQALSESSRSEETIRVTDVRLKKRALEHENVQESLLKAQEEILLHVEEKAKLNVRVYCKCVLELWRFVRVS